ncbi:GntR family transcriptional regulator [Sinosporangium siamense]|uniref:HTH gntR-type domain-containing protein n=1 Tax=Sinosporangium siamense TaxID=1367973 RepID=A0A919RKK0_9ACTN|nr:GntR family transcriptional regulator [Sinosporangium siamense]GII95488.1 hypothetical protein Ssi02_57190 [Sinosporangium siamense]
MLNRESHIPLYLQVADHIRADIAAGVLGPGRVIPSERELSRQYSVSLATVRRALAELRGTDLVHLPHRCYAVPSSGRPRHPARSRKPAAPHAPHAPRAPRVKITIECDGNSGTLQAVLRMLGEQGR